MELFGSELELFFEESSLLSVEGDSATLSDEHGKPVLINPSL